MRELKIYDKILDKYTKNTYIVSAFHYFLPLSKPESKDERGGNEKAYG